MNAAEMAQKLKDDVVAAMQHPTGNLPAGVVVERDYGFMLLMMGDPKRPPSQYPASFWARLRKRPQDDAELVWYEWSLVERNEMKSRNQQIPSTISIEIIDGAFKNLQSLNEMLSRFGLENYIGVLCGLCHLVLWRRITNDQQNQRALQVEQCLMAGGLPCALEPDRPDGKLVVYWPHEGIEPRVGA